MSQKNLFLIVAIPEPAELFAHAIFHHHRAGHVGRLLNIVRRTGVQFVMTIDELFGDTPTESEREPCLHLLHVHAETVAFGQIPRYAERTAARNNRDLMQWIAMRNVERN